MGKYSKLLLMPTLLTATTPIIGVTSCSYVKVDFFDNGSQASKLASLASEPFEIQLDTTYKLNIDISKCVGSSLQYDDISYLKIVRVSDSQRTTAEFEVSKYICDGRKLELIDCPENGDDTYYYKRITNPDGVNVKATYKENLKQNSIIQINLKFKTVEPTGNVRIEFYNCF